MQAESCLHADGVWITRRQILTYMQTEYRGTLWRTLPADRRAAPLTGLRVWGARRGVQIVQAHELVGGKHPGGKVIVTF